MRGGAGRGERSALAARRWLVSRLRPVPDPRLAAAELRAAGALAVLTRRLQFGHLVLGNTYRHPAVVANMGATLDHLAPGRFVLGLCREVFTPEWFTAHAQGSPSTGSWSGSG